MAPIIFDRNFLTIAREIPMRSGSELSHSPRNAQHRTAEYWTSATKNAIWPKVPECKPRPSNALSQRPENTVLQNSENLERHTRFERVCARPVPIFQRRLP